MVEGCQAGGLGHLLQYMREYNAESQKQGRKRFNSIVKTIGFDHLVIIYLWVFSSSKAMFPQILLFQSTRVHDNKLVWLHAVIDD